MKKLVLVVFALLFVASLGFAQPGTTANPTPLYGVATLGTATGSGSFSCYVWYALKVEADPANGQLAPIQAIVGYDGPITQLVNKWNLTGEGNAWLAYSGITSSPVTSTAGSELSIAWTADTRLNNAGMGAVTCTATAIKAVGHGSQTFSVGFTVAYAQ